MKFSCQNGMLIPEQLLAPEQAQLHNPIPISQIESLPPPPKLNPHFSYSNDLQKLLSGKQLLLDDIPFPLQDIHRHYENGYLTYRKSIEIEKNKLTCVRCGNQQKHLFASFPCARCRETCTYCRKCIMMGRTSTCSPLISWTGPPIPIDITAPPLQWAGNLSAGQGVASSAVVAAVHKTDSLLVWAVCGAGKTEVLFQGINTALMEGKRVCLATPRTDVVLELSPRLKKVFPDIPVASLYGGSEDRHLYAPLTIATTHQLFRFYQAFDVVVLDEVDAFPYSVEESLQYAVEQARKPVSSIIYLTATPNEKWRKECKTGKRDYVTIPARFHRYSLPVPRFVWCGNWQKPLKKGKLPGNVLRWMTKRLDENQQVLLFFPRIELMEKILPVLKNIHPAIEAVHAEDPERKEKVQRMRNKEILILLTTTILERGVTFPKLDVAVIGAEDRIFTESALVQIAGRVGRSADFPSGDITFFHYGKTDAMVKARRQIIQMNKEARGRKLIDD
ncbi:DEAD/DEAH box helicase [Bacillus tuaregi]|uniref:DEAD/DEAH box helicase n=1 Tax=Bacillus tuaregi TaxID=1816695 RepID=UPI0008F83A2E|nr:DEAD/DEAH box helicase [Bacillus tuaregi]